MTLCILSVCSWRSTLCTDFAHIGEVPFSHMLPVAVVMAVAVRKEKPRLPPDVDHRSRELIDGCIAWQPEDRLTIPQVCLLVVIRGKERKGEKGRETCLCVCLYGFMLFMITFNCTFELLQPYWRVYSAGY